ncbi:DJ-1/PfpI family protein [Pseudoalteromonas luteoviolacea]|uniref:DJ-1/PfpI family protein n=1 Tax=Pseudoalteromonas luteoviolacea TaxID=43657 RepID=UPI001B3621C2|nr:DJ-1/PfpI family protein [Pseudoalteromonas luteoviolacea]MBQ4839319.1 DJ-1/PfpI family protein [Pseudoalteromonas luteoviolacea]
MKKRIMMWLMCLCCMKVNAHSTDPDAFHVGILLFDGAQAIDFVGPVEVFGQAGFRLTTVSKDGAEITTAMGLKVTPDQRLEPTMKFDAILIPGGSINGRLIEDPIIQNWIVAQSHSADYVMSVCNGAFILANTGLLDGLYATTIEKAFDSFARQYPAVKLARDKKFTDNGKVLTTAGLSSGIDGALSLVAKVSGMRSARTVAAKIEYDWVPSGGYIRGKMADRVLPEFGALPAGVALLDKTFHYGDEQNWFQGHVFDIGSKQSSRLSSWLDQQMKSAGWQAVSSDNTLVWSKRLGEQQWLLHVSVSHLQGTQFSTQLTLNRQI